MAGTERTYPRRAPGGLRFGQGLFHGGRLAKVHRSRRRSPDGGILGRAGRSPAEDRIGKSMTSPGNGASLRSETLQSDQRNHQRVASTDGPSGQGPTVPRFASSYPQSPATRPNEFWRTVVSAASP